MNRNVSLLLSIFIFPLMLPGCAALIYGGAAAGGAIWYKGELKESIAGPVNRVHAAGVQAVKNLKFTVDKQNHDEVQGEIEGEMANGTGVKINMKSEGNNVTEVRIRIGIMVDEHVSRRLIEEMKKILGAKTD